MRALLITGPVGVSKTTVAEAVGDVLAAAEVPHAVVDLDWLSYGWPSPPDDPFNFALPLRNLSAVARNHVDAGARFLVLAGVVENRAGRDRYAETIGMDLAVCRLSADLPVVRQRLAGRHHDDESLRWHENRSRELEKIFASASVEDFAVAADRPVAEVADAVLAGAGWRAEIGWAASE